MNTTTISDAQLRANQANAQKSTGPRTESGKLNSKFNARRHGLTGQFYCLSPEDEAACKIFEAQMLHDLKPVGAWESNLAIAIVQDHWRINRSRSIESNIYVQTHDAADLAAPATEADQSTAMANTFLQDDRTFANIALYEARIHRMAAKNQKELRELQAERKAAEAAARREAELLTRLAQLKEERIDPASSLEVNGFVFSNRELIAAVERQSLLAEALHYEKHKWTTRIPYQKGPSPLAKAA